MSNEERTDESKDSAGSERLLRVTPGYVEYYFGGSVPRDEAAGKTAGEPTDENAAEPTDESVDTVSDASSKTTDVVEVEESATQAEPREEEDARDAAPAPRDGEVNAASEGSKENPASSEATPTHGASESALAAEVDADAGDALLDAGDDAAEVSAVADEVAMDDVSLSEEAEDGGDMERTDGGLPGWLDLVITLACTLVLVFFIRTFVAEAYEVPTGSMLETIQLGDRLVGEKVSLHWREPQEGDIVTFADPDGENVTLIKRVIATEGQVVDLQDGSVIVDGQVLNESYTLGKPSYPLDHYAGNLSEKVTFPLTVPEGHIWVMGDNRTNSLDSRYFGPVPVDSVTSIGVFIFWPPSDAQML